MRVSLQKSYKVNMGNYESVEVSAHVTLDEDDLDPGTLDGLDREARMDKLQELAIADMNAYLEPELSVLAGKTSGPSMLTPPAPPRRERATRSKRSKS